MSNPDLELHGVDDPRLAVHGVSALPAWLWSLDGTRILWANPVGAHVFDAPNAVQLARRVFGPADQHRRQVAQLASRLKADRTRLERLRGFGSTLGALVTCGCTRLTFADGRDAILIVAAEPVGRGMPLIERLQRLVDGIETPIAAFARDGMFIEASETARALSGFRNLSDAGLESARSEALRDGRAETPIGVGRVVLQRVGSGNDVGLVALLALGPIVTTGTDTGRLSERTRQPELPEQAPSPFMDSARMEAEPARPEEAASEQVKSEPSVSIPDYEQPALLAEAPAEFMLVDEFADEELVSETRPELEPDRPPADWPDADVPHVTVQHEASVEPASAATQRGVDEPARNESEAGSFKPFELPLRFIWQIDADGAFTVTSDEFRNLIGPVQAARLGQSWQSLAEGANLDPDGRVAQAIATQQAWSGLVVDWPTDGGGAVPIQLSGLPVHGAQGFAGYRGFGICHDLDAMARAMISRLSATRGPSPLSADIVQPGPAADTSDDIPPSSIPAADFAADEHSEQSPISTQQDGSVETPPNVVPFRPTADLRPPTLTPVENNAFNELARQLSERLDHSDVVLTAPDLPSQAGAGEQHDAKQPQDHAPAPAPVTQSLDAAPVLSNGAAPTPAEWLTSAPPAPRGNGRIDRPLFDLLPGGVLIYRLDRLLYANPAFLRSLGYDTLRMLEDAGGLDALMVEPGVSAASSTSSTGTPVTIASASAAAEQRSRIDANLFAIEWDGEGAHALLCAAPRVEPAVMPDEQEPLQAGAVDAEELGAILDTTAEGIVMFDDAGRISACNRSAEALFGYSGDQMIAMSFSDLFAQESQRDVADYFDSVKEAGLSGLLSHGREALGRTREGGLIPLSLTMGQTRPDGPNFFVVFRDLSQSRKSEGELLQARRLAERSAGAKADVLARISHEVRMPLNAIIGFAEVMIDERFGALGNERYIEYMKDIRASGERVVAIINDLLDLSQIETGKLSLAFTSQNLNDLIEQCVAILQPQANRERIIIRSSLAHTLPPVVADARALRQIALNLIGNSIHLANAGGQVIVSTAVSDSGEIVLRVRDTGPGLNDNEVAAAMEPFRTPAPEDRTSRNSAVSLSLTKALVEANRARFAIKATSQGTLIEITFAPRTETA